MNIHQALLPFLISIAFSSPAWAKDARKEILQSCAQQAKDQSFTGDAHAEFMRTCLKKPDDVQPPVFSSGEPQVLPKGQTIQPAMTQPSKAPMKPGKSDR